MTKKFIYLSLIIVFSLLSACGQEEENNAQNNEMPQFVDVTVSIEPVSLEPGDAATIKATVTQGSEAVNDADEMTFEIWRDVEGAEHHKIDAELEGNGVYSIDYTFKENGVYQVIAHVTARDMHVMPREQINVGDITIQESAEVKEDESTHNHDENEDSHHNDNENAQEQEAHENGESHSHNQLLFDFENSEVTVNQEITLTVHLQKDHEIFEGASVAFEVKNNAEEQHSYYPATEASPGEYQTLASFQEEGTYNLIIHVKKDELHEHQDYSLYVHSH